MGCARWLSSLEMLAPEFAAFASPMPQLASSYYALERIPVDVQVRASARSLLPIRIGPTDGSAQHAQEFGRQRVVSLRSTRAIQVLEETNFNSSTDVNPGLH